jgi:hypothetical protein
MVTWVIRAAFVIVIATLILGHANAQDMMIFCGELSDADCALLSESQAAMSALGSAAVKFDLDMTFAGIPDMPVSVTLNLSGDARYAVTDVEALQIIAAKMTDDPASAMEELFRAFALDGTFILQLPVDIVGESNANRGAFSLRLVDGFIYANADKMSELIGAAGENGWLGFDLAGFYGRIFDQFGSSAIPNQSAAADMMADLVAIERVEDVELDGQTLTVFHYTVDYSGLATNEDFMSLLRNQLEGMGMSMQVDMDALMDFYAEAFAGLKLEFTQLISLEDHFVHNMTFQLDWGLDMASLGELFGGMTEPVPDITITISANVDLSQFNVAAPIEAPEDATLFPLDSLLPAMPQAFEVEATA